MENHPEKKGSPITIFFCGDVMIGRGIDQILPHPGDPTLYEPYMTRAQGYVEIAERAGATISIPVDFTYIWGDALEALRRISPDARIINLETAITKADDYWKGKAIHYRMSPDNVACLTAAGIDCCCLANNHVLDWGYPGLAETLETLRKAGIQTVGAGRNRSEAQRPAVLNTASDRRILVYNCGAASSGISQRWAAAEDRPGINLLAEMTGGEIFRIRNAIEEVRRPGDVVLFSVHWGPNWGFGVDENQVDFAHELIDSGVVDLVYGHSSHHVKGAEIYRGRPVFYGCGDFLNDYEGIGGHTEYRGDLGLMYFATVQPSSGKLPAMQMIPTRVKDFRVRYASRSEAAQLKSMLQKGLSDTGTRVKLCEDGTLALSGRPLDPES